MKRDIIVTNDGSHSLYIPELGETFHSKHGAIQESLHVYINNGLKLIDFDEINVLEFGFGTGLNALLTYEFALNKNKIIHYETVEAYPLKQEEYIVLNYDEFINTNVSLQQLHEINSNEKFILNEHFSILKHFVKIEDFYSTKKFDILYFDVFGYDFQPELWSEAILEKTYNLLNNNGIFVTYACKSIVTKRLKNLGFKVHKLPGAPGKREMTVAVK